MEGERGKEERDEPREIIKEEEVGKRKTYFTAVHTVDGRVA